MAALRVTGGKNEPEKDGGWKNQRESRERQSDRHLTEREGRERQTDTAGEKLSVAKRSLDFTLILKD